MEHGFSRDELRVLRPLTTPRKIQDFLDAIPVNFETNGDTCLSPRRVLRERQAHCMEGAMLAAAALRLAGFRPLLVDLKSARKDYDHVIAVFQEHGCWGALSKTNHCVLRYREPIYRSIRELAMSYFHEYYLENGRKTLRSYSGAVDLTRFDKRGWLTAEENVWYVPAYIDDVRHYPMLTPAQVARLRRADPIERQTVAVAEWPDPAGA